MQAKQLSIFITISVWAMLIGGIMYSHIVYMPAYLGHLPESNSLIRGAYGLKDENFWMVIHPFAILSTIVSLVLNWKNKERRRLISITSIIFPRQHNQSHFVRMHFRCTAYIFYHYD